MFPQKIFDPIIAFIRKQNQVNMDHLKIVLPVICHVFQLALIENLID